MAVFQPGEETAQGAQAMIDDSLFKRFPKPDVILWPACHELAIRAPRLAYWSCDLFRRQPANSNVRTWGAWLDARGQHRSVVMAASTVVRLQTIVSREVGPTDSAVVTIGVLQAGTKENVIPDDAIIKLNVRTFDSGIRKHVLAAIERIVNAEAAAAGAPKPPEITPLDRYSLVTNDVDATEKVVDAFRQNFPDGSVEQTKPTMASEDFGCFGAEWHAPAVYWFFGGDDPEVYDKATKDGTLSGLPTNHNPRFAPVIHPTLQTGVKALVVAAHAWLAS
jgi:metal-dependent amidase/aminoacylase/carboxypeptidase family protein